MELHGFLNIDKPLGWTSHDVVGRLRRILRTRKIGHAGTLDPAATGVLVVGVGRATRFLDYVQDGSKSYAAHIVLGVSSETADIDGRVAERNQHESLPTRRDIEAILPEFAGVIDQVPPKYSAVKQDGEPLYRRMRRGEDVEVPTRTVSVDSLKVIGFNYPDLVISIDCGSGVYVRSLARDIGERLGTIAYLHHLVRTSVGRFDLASGLSIDALEQFDFPESWTSVAIGIDAGLAGFAAVALNERSTDSWYHGRSIHVRSDSSRPTNGQVRVFAADGSFAGIAAIGDLEHADIRLQPRIVLAKN